MTELAIDTPEPDIAAAVQARLIAVLRRIDVDRLSEDNLSALLVTLHDLESALDEAGDEARSRAQGA